MLENQTKQIILHKRATCLLELLKKAQGEQSRQEGLLAEWRGAGNYDNIRLFTHENNYLIRLAELNDIQKRILKSYYWLVVELYDITENFMLPVKRVH
jgi:muconolactone delta-isomerase